MNFPRTGLAKTGSVSYMKSRFRGYGLSANILSGRLSGRSLDKGYLSFPAESILGLFLPSVDKGSAGMDGKFDNGGTLGKRTPPFISKLPIKPLRECMAIRVKVLCWLRLKLSSPRATAGCSLAKSRANLIIVSIGTPVI